MARLAKEFRCPYCADGGAFRLLAGLPDGSQCCESCGHTVFPSDSTRECNCFNCQRLRLAATRISPSKKAARLKSGA